MVARSTRTALGGRRAFGIAMLRARGSLEQPGHMLTLAPGGAVPGHDAWSGRGRPSRRAVTPSAPRIPVPWIPVADAPRPGRHIRRRGARPCLLGGDALPPWMLLTTQNNRSLAILSMRAAIWGRAQSIFTSPSPAGLCTRSTTPTLDGSSAWWPRKSAGGRLDRRITAE
ncbi:MULTISPECIES: hypothetical protein [unclassified Paracoccus (in: a-proteobacteria)]|uniref:hypothetical protein n=1 Tax=unclassified Paracoccus (in: a-proteobacteria) TaxID=2688777 RepID=UPI003FA3C66B